MINFHYLITYEKDVSYGEINADGGHDAFLMENEHYFEIMRSFINEACDGV